MTRQLYEVEIADKLTEKLRALPEVAPAKRKVTKQEIVKMLMEEIESLLQRGYALDQVAEAISGDGFDITGPVLKSYINRAKAENGTKRHSHRSKHGASGKQKGNKLETNGPQTHVAEQAAVKSAVGKNKMHMMDDSEVK